jgi:ankyrin repeat protein
MYQKMYQKTAIAVALSLSLGFAAGMAHAEHELADAVMNQNTATIEALLGKGADVNEAQLDDTTALHYAVYQDNLALAKRLIAAGADVDAVTRLGATPLYLAAVNGNSAMIAALLAAGADPKATVLSHNETPLMFAARSGAVDAVKVLLDAGADIEAVDDYRGATSLLFAAEENHAAVVSYLAERGANVNVRTKTEVQQGRRGPALVSGGLTALILASREGGIDTVKALLNAKALVNQQSAQGHTALLTAIQNANVDIANVLIDAGADVSLANDRGWNPLYMAIKMRSLEKGTMPNPVVDMDAMYNLVERMVNKGANVNARLLADTEVHNSIRSTWLDEAGGTPFLRASLCGDLKVMKLLLAHGADPLIATSNNTTALAALAGVGYTKGFMHDVGTVEESIEAMKMLIAAGIDLNAKNSDEVAAIHGAAHKNFVQAIQLLVDSGADLTSHSNRRGQFQRTDGISGNTVLDWADGFQTGMESAIYNAEAVELVEKLLKERGLPLERLSGTVGGRVAQQQ